MSRHRTERTSTGTDRRRRTLQVAVPVLLVVSSVVACTASLPPAPRTAKVERTSVTSGVSAAGSLTALNEANLGFAAGGQLTAVNVKVGDRVEVGQVLATIDDYAAQQALRQAQAQLAAQQAVLSGVDANPSVGNAQATLDQAREILSDTEAQGDAVQDADDVAIDNAENQVSVAKKALGNAKDAYEDCVRQAESAASSQSVLGAVTGGGSGSASTGTTAGNTGGRGSSGSSSSVTATCASAKAAVDQARAAVAQAEAARDAAEQKKEVDRAASDVAVANAQQGVVSAQNALNSASASRPSSIDQQAALVTNAQAAVAAAQRTLDNTTLRAPAAGTVTVVNGAVGEFLSAAGNTTSALAPGTNGTIPGASGASTSGAGGAAAAGGASPSRPGGTQFIVLDDLAQFQVVMPFSESDAAAIAANQKVQVNFDAVPDLTVTGSVIAVGPAGTALSGVISYYVTATLPQADPRLKAGMTARGEVVTKEIPNVLAVPTTAVRKSTGGSTVTVLAPDGSQRQVTIQTGAAGDGKTEVVSGLQEGDAVVLPPTP